LGTGEELIRHIRSRSGGTCLLSFSTGQHSTASWLALRPHFERIVPVFCYLIPELEFVEESLAYFEGFFGQRIHRMPHPSLYRMLRNFVLQPPERCALIEDMQLPEFSFDDVFAIVKADLGLPEDTWTAIGLRRDDSPNRRAHIGRHGPLNERRRTFYPIFDWPKRRVLDTLRGAGVRLPEDYPLFGRSFDGIDYRFIKPLAERRPRDYARILEWFPLADIDIERIKFRERYFAQQPQ
jgi:hypothetical protein